MLLSLSLEMVMVEVGHCQKCSKMCGISCDMNSETYWDSHQASASTCGHQHSPWITIRQYGPICRWVLQVCRNVDERRQNFTKLVCCSVTCLTLIPDVFRHGELYLEVRWGKWTQLDVQYIPTVPQRYLYFSWQVDYLRCLNYLASHICKKAQSKRETVILRSFYATWNISLLWHLSARATMLIPKPRSTTTGRKCFSINVCLFSILLASILTYYSPRCSPRFSNVCYLSVNLSVHSCVLVVWCMMMLKSYTRK